MDRTLDQQRSARNVAALALVGMGALLLLLVLWVARAPAPVAAQTERPPDAACRLCHGDHTGALSLPSGEALSLRVDLEALAASVHGPGAPAPVYCTDCHRNETGYRYPHVTNPVQSVEAFRASIAPACQACHQELGRHNPGHLLAEDPSRTPVCTDCHGGHEVEPAANLNQDPVGFCQSCHGTYEDPRVAQAHEAIAPRLTGEISCRTCHADQALYPDDQLCRTCHGLLESTVTLPSGEEVDLHVDEAVLAASVHGTRLQEVNGYEPLRCTSCHRDPERYTFPHPALEETDLRHLTLAMDDLCQECHTEIAAREQDSVHAEARAEGKLEAASCADCHGSHAIQPPNEPRERISQTCSQCHAKINEQYAQSVHGAALLGEHNPDVPVCTDCHGVHDIPRAQTAEFRVTSPDTCGECHADEALMAKYGISTQVFETYVADFHGTTVELFEKQTPWQETNKAVCYDCHGIHNILPPTDEHSSVMRENLANTCRQCHPDANSNFPDAWLGHYQPTWETAPLVYAVNLFYRIVIPVTIGGFLLFISTDVYRRLSDRLRSRKEESA